MYCDSKRMTFAINMLYAKTHCFIKEMPCRRESGYRPCGRVESRIAGRIAGSAVGWVWTGQRTRCRAPCRHDCAGRIQEVLSKGPFVGQRLIIPRWAQLLWKVRTAPSHLVPSVRLSSLYCCFPSNTLLLSFCARMRTPWPSPSKLTSGI